MEITDLFATPLARVERLLSADGVAALLEQLAPAARQANAQSEKLSHTAPVLPEMHPLLGELSRLIDKPLTDFGELLFGERLRWSIKEMWLNVLEPGGYQRLHNHANSFVSGVIYLSASDASATTVFSRAPGGHDFVFRNTNARARLGPYNADKWVSPEPNPGDMVLFPSYLLHEVPVNQGARRLSLAFNAIPDRLDSWGYTLGLSR
jgi:uncharacterized protein (TIGR02466 family)